MLQRKGSTLIELLVCLAIGLILISILFVVARLAWKAVHALGA